MLAGHYAAAYALKVVRPTVSLWALFVAVQAVDIAFFVLALTGAETLRINAGARGPLAMNLEHIPYTHSLTMTVLYAVSLLVAGVAAKRLRAASVLAAALVSHWCLDLLVHTHDLPLTMSGGAKAGLGLWVYPIPALALEVGLMLIAYAALRRVLQPGTGRTWADIGAGALLVVQLVYVFGPPPATVVQMAMAAQAIYAAMAVLAYQVDRPRVG